MESEDIAGDVFALSNTFNTLVSSANFAMTAFSGVRRQK